MTVYAASLRQSREDPALWDVLDDDEHEPCGVKGPVAVTSSTLTFELVDAS